MTHDELQNDLAAHLRASTDRMVWCNTQLGPAGSPRPDVYSVNKSFARFHAAAYEIKVSVSDLRHDITSGKWQSYREFAHCVWFAFPKGLVPMELIPAECGIILRGESCWRAHRKPVAQVLDSLPRDAWLKLLMDGGESVAHPSPRNASMWTQEKMLRKRLGDDVADLYRDREAAKSRLEYETRRLNDSAEEIKKETARSLESARNRADRLNKDMIDLGIALGMTPSTVNANSLCSKLNTLHDQIGAQNIDRAIRSLELLKSALPTPWKQEAIAA